MCLVKKDTWNFSKFSLDANSFWVVWAFHYFRILVTSQLWMKDESFGWRKFDKYKIYLGLLRLGESINRPGNLKVPIWYWCSKVGGENKKLPVIWRVSYPKLLYDSLSRKQISRSTPDVAQRLTIFVISRFTNSKIFWKSDYSFEFVLFWSFLWLFVAFLCCKQQNQRATLNHELTMRRIVRVPEPRCQADENRLSSSAACKNDNTWASQPSSQRAAKAAVRRPSLLPSLSPSLSLSPSQSLPRSPLREPMTSTAAVAATIS